jgi:5'-deoxy-5'-methylthioadenosine phosphorylase
MSKIAVLGGSHFSSLKKLSLTHSASVQTPFGEPSAPLSYGILGDKEVVYLPRRGSAEHMAAHKINYRANIWALRDAGVQTILATAAVAGISPHFSPGDLVIPNQLIDYTYGRENTFWGEDANVTHIDFTEPYSDHLRKIIIHKAQDLSVKIQTQATYGITQGPRLETRAEAQKLANDGCHLVGMTGMPEAALARELGLDYACIALVIRNAVEEFNDQSRIEAGSQLIEQLIEAIIL